MKHHQHIPFETLEQYEDGRINRQSSRLIEEHLLTCPTCADHLDRVRRSREDIQTMTLANHQKSYERLSDREKNDLNDRLNRLMEKYPDAGFSEFEMAAEKRKKQKAANRVMTAVQSYQNSRMGKIAYAASSTTRKVLSKGIVLPDGNNGVNGAGRLCDDFLPKIIEVNADVVGAEEGSRPSFDIFLDGLNDELSGGKMLRDAIRIKNYLKGELEKIHIDLTETGLISVMINMNSETAPGQRVIEKGKSYFFTVIMAVVAAIKGWEIDSDIVFIGYDGYTDDRLMEKLDFLSRDKHISRVFVWGDRALDSLIESYTGHGIEVKRVEHWADCLEKVFASHYSQTTLFEKISFSLKRLALPFFRGLCWSLVVVWSFAYLYYGVHSGTFLFPLYLNLLQTLKAGGPSLVEWITLFMNSQALINGMGVAGVAAFVFYMAALLNKKKYKKAALVNEWAAGWIVSAFSLPLFLALTCFVVQHIHDGRSAPDIYRLDQLYKYTDTMDKIKAFDAVVSDVDDSLLSQYRRLYEGDGHTRALERNFLDIAVRIPPENKNFIHYFPFARDILLRSHNVNFSDTFVSDMAGLIVSNYLKYFEAMAVSEESRWQFADTASSPLLLIERYGLDHQLKNELRELHDKFHE